MKRRHPEKIFFLLISLFLLFSNFHSQNNWTWIKGFDGLGAKGTYGTLGVPTASNTPGARYTSLTWTDLNGNLWLYGGFGKDTGFVSAGAMADLWKFDISLGQWVWVTGSNINYQGTNPIYGTMGVASSSNTPGFRSGSATWTDGSGNLWLFGGNAMDLTGTGSCNKNDIWKYNIASNMWTWVSGSSTCYPLANYGTKGVSTSSNVPGGRAGMRYWKDASGNLWIFGGFGVINSTTTGDMNDLWKYDPSLNQWVWVSGSSSFNQLSSYGTQGVASSTTVPGARRSSSTWIDKTGTFWLFGGTGYDAAGNYGGLSDLWKYNPSTNQWTWVRGSNLRNQLPVYGSMNVLTSNSQPGAMGENAAWVDSTGNNLWMGIGSSSNPVSSSFYTNIMWKYNIPSNQWVWVKGPNVLADQIGVYGTQGVPAMSNIPGGRTSSCWWQGNNGRFWLFGGFGMGSNSCCSQLLNDLWNFDPCFSSASITNTTSTSNATLCANLATTLSASSTGTISWYDVNNNLLGTGNVFSTPVLSISTTYILADNISCLPISITVSVTPSPTLNMSASNTVICLGKTATLSAFSNAAFSLWDTGATNYSTTVTPSATATYSILITAYPTGCTNSGAITISVNPLPTVSILATSSLVCQGGSVTLSALSSAGTYSWMHGGSGSLTTVSPGSTSTYTLRVTAANGCSNTALQTISVNPLPTATISASSNMICLGGAANLSVVTSAGTFSWMQGGSNSLITVTPTTTSTYTLIMTDSNGCGNTALKTVTVNPLPVVSISASSNMICQGGTVSLTALTGAGTFSWTQGGNNASSTVTPGNTSTYTVLVTDANGCSNTAIKTITVNPLPVVGIVASASTVCLGGTVMLSGTGADSYSWSSAVTNGQVFTPGSTNTYSLTGTNSLTGCQSTNTATQLVIVKPLPSLSVNASTTGICSGGTVVLNGVNADLYVWTGGLFDGLAFTPQQTNTYTLTGTNTLTGCSNTISQSVVVFPLPQLTISASAYSVCEGTPVTFTASGADSFVWSGGVINAQPFIPASTQTYSVSGTYSLTGCTNTISQGLAVFPVPHLTISASAYTVCSGNPVTLTASGADSFTWSGGVTNAQSFTPTSTQTYTVLGSYSLTGCTSGNSALQTIQVNALPILTVTAGDICLGETAVLLASGAQSYTWSTSEQGASIVVSPTISTTYTVSGNDANGCLNSLVQTQVVNLCTGISSLQKSSTYGFTIYPNPNKGHFVISAVEGMNLSIFDEIGQLIYTTRLSAREQKLSLAEKLPAGIYFVVGQKEEILIKRKIIVID